MWISVTSIPWFSGRGLHMKRSCHVMSYYVFAYVEEEVCVSVHTPGQVVVGCLTGWREQCLPEQSTGISMIQEPFETFVLNLLSPRRVEMLLGTMWMGLEDICGLPPSIHFPSSVVSWWFPFLSMWSECGFSPQGVWGSGLTHKWIAFNWPQ